ncbi:MAG: hypothetical protein WD049_01245 [Candidatus Paceibacterota bacterium]
MFARHISQVICFVLPLVVASSKAADAVVLLDASPLIVDPATHSVSAVLHVKNVTGEPASVSLSAGDFISKTTKRGMGASVSFGKPSESNGSRIYKLSKLSPGDTTPVEITVTNLWEAGESEADLYNNGNKIGTLNALNFRVPFAITLVADGSEIPEIVFQADKEQRLLLKNNDAMTYPITWDLTVGGQAVSGKRITMPPNGNASITIAPPDAWFTSRFSSLFKEEIRDGVLTIRYAPSSDVNGPDLPVEAIPIKANLRWRSSGWNSFASNVAIFLALLAGGVCSLVLSQWVPNRLRRLDLKEQLEALALKTRSLSGQLDSSLRVLVRVERVRLNRLLYSRWIMSPDMATVFAHCVQHLALLNRQVDILESIDSAYDRLTEVRLGPPSLLDQIEDDLREAASILNNSAFHDSKLQAAQTLVADAIRRLSDVNQPDPEFAGKLAKKFDYLDKVFDSIATPPDPVAASKTRERIEKIIPGPFRFLTHLTDPSQIQPMQYAEADRNFCKLELVRDYVSLLDNSVDRTTFESHEKELVYLLARDNWESLKAAKSLVAQMHEGIFAADIEAAIRDEEVQVEMEPPIARRNWPMRLSARFTNPMLDRATAKNRFRCVWDFGHHGLKETGWTVYHYFPDTETYTLKACFAGPGGRPLKTKNGKQLPPLELPIVVDSDSSATPRDRFWTEIIQLSIALAVALFALMAGAREQLMRLDLIPALIAIFGIGFAADTIKNLLTPQPKE